MDEQFRLKGEPMELCSRLGTEFGCLTRFSGADELDGVLHELSASGILECPKDLSVIVYPRSVEDSHVALITVVSTANADAHVVAASEEMRKLATRELWEGTDRPALTVEIVANAIARASAAVLAVRELEARGAGQVVVTPARCPRCGAEDHLRLEYRYDLLGFAGDGSPVLAEGGELTDIFCLACGEEVEDVEGIAGPVFAGDGGERRA